MGLARSIFAGASGLRNHQTMLDVIGNNIANVNTVGFKLGRVSFAETFAQTLRGTTQPLSNIGGSNPIQVGLGMSLSAIDTIFSQGNIETTGQVTDLALEGDGFFIVSDGHKKYYTRAGGFQFDGSGFLINPSNGFRVQGKTANEDGMIEASATVGDIQLPFGQKIQAKETTMSEIAGNLDADAQPQGTILQTEKMFAVELAGSDSDIAGLYGNGNANYTITGMVDGSTSISINYNGVRKSFTYVQDDSSTSNGSFNSLDDLIAEISNDTDLGGVLNVALNTSGQLVFTDAGAADTNFDIGSTNPVLQNALTSVSSADLSLGAATSDEFSHVAISTDLVTNLRDDQGQSLGLVVGDEISINGLVGDPDDLDNPPSAITQATLAVGATTSYNEYAVAIKNAFSLSNSEGVEISAADGSLLIHADAGMDYNIVSVDINADDTPGAGGTNRVDFNNLFDSSVGNYDLVQEAQDVQQSASVTVFDSLGKEYNLTLIFTKDTKAPNRWKWEATVPSGSTISGGGSGTVEFDTTGTLKKFSYDDGSSTLQFTPGDNGDSELLSINLDPGELGSLNGLTQMAGAGNSLIIRDQDGYSMGELERISIGEAGQITGSFTNGIIKTLGQLTLAAFNNPSGLLRTKDNMYSASANTGDPIIGTAGSGVKAIVRSGALEQSNVDLAEEFTKLIVAQRGFQANARVITTSDTMLTEVTNLKR